MNEQDSPSLLVAGVGYSNPLVIPSITQALYLVSKYQVLSPVIVVPAAL